jgi:2-polyprenyl-3-methyl-5-hydroxy-6-metoxy-1,4-benzoquinol methylase
MAGATAIARGGNLYDKYATRNPLARALMARFLASFDELAGIAGASEAHEVGCGEGELALRLARGGLSVRGTDVAEPVIEEARRRAAAADVAATFEVASLGELDGGRDGAELVVCCEVLEHVPGPHRALETIAALARPWAILSVPREPLWRALNLARLSYVRELGNTPGHVNHWSRRSFVASCARHLDIVAVRSPLPWTMVLARARAGAAS